MEQQAHPKTNTVSSVCSCDMLLLCGVCVCMRVYVEFGDKQGSGVNYVMRLKASLKANTPHSLSMNIVRGPTGTFSAV